MGPKTSRPINSQSRPIRESEVNYRRPLGILLRSDTPEKGQTVIRASVTTWERQNGNLQAYTHTVGSNSYHAGEATRDPWLPRAASGRDAYSGGWPGEGGKGGTVTSAIASAPVEADIVAMQAGDHGDPTPQVAGTAPPGPHPAYDMLVIVTARVHASETIPRTPSVTLRDVSGVPGRTCPGLRLTSEGKPGDRYYENRNGIRLEANNYEGLLNAVKVLPPRHGGRDGNLMPNNLAAADDLSWLHPGALTATVTYARMAYRNGFREQAATAIEPYTGFSGTGRRSRRRSIRMREWP